MCIYQNCTFLALSGFSFSGNFRANNELCFGTKIGPGKLIAASRTITIDCQLVPLKIETSPHNFVFPIDSKACSWNEKFHQNLLDFAEILGKSKLPISLTSVDSLCTKHSLDKEDNDPV